MPDGAALREAPPLPSPDRLQALLFDAARIGRDDVIPALLQAGADIETRDARGYTALILASYNDQRSTTALLLNHGADVDGPDQARGNTPLMGVAFKGHEQIARLLVAAGAQIDQRNLAGQTALMNAAMFGHMAIVDLLLDHGADPQAAAAVGNSPTSIAGTQGNTAMTARIAQAIAATGAAERRG